MCVEPGEQFALQRAAREIGMPAFRRQRGIAVALPDQLAHAETGAGTDHRARAVRARRAWLEYVQIVRRECIDAIGLGLEIVDQTHGGNAEAARQMRGIDVPADVGDARADAIGGDGAGDGEAGAARCGVSAIDRRQEMSDHVFERDVIGTGVAFTGDDAHDASAFFGEGEQCLGAADVGREQAHASIPPSIRSSRAARRGPDTSRVLRRDAVAPPDNRPRAR